MVQASSPPKHPSTHNSNPTPTSSPHTLISTNPQHPMYPRQYHRVISLQMRRRYCREQLRQNRKMLQRRVHRAWVRGQDGNSRMVSTRGSRLMQWIREGSTDLGAARTEEARLGPNSLKQNRAKCECYGYSSVLIFQKKLRAIISRLRTKMPRETLMMVSSRSMQVRKSRPASIISMKISLKTQPNRQGFSLAYNPELCLNALATRNTTTARPITICMQNVSARYRPLLPIRISLEGSALALTGPQRENSCRKVGSRLCVVRSAVGCPLQRKYNIDWLVSLRGAYRQNRQATNCISSTVISRLVLCRNTHSRNRASTRLMRIRQNRAWCRLGGELVLSGMWMIGVSAQWQVSAEGRYTTGARTMVKKPNATYCWTG